MLKIEEIKELIKLIDETAIDEFTYEFDGAKIELKKRKVEAAFIANQTFNQENVQANLAPKAPARSANAIDDSKASVKTAETEENSSELHKITSPMVGTFYASPKPDADPYVTIGSKVKENTVVCIVEAMKLFNEIEAEVKGEIVDVLVENGQLVEYGQPLFLVKPE